MEDEAILHPASRLSGVARCSHTPSWGLRPPAGTNHLSGPGGAASRQNAARKYGRAYSLYWRAESEAQLKGPDPGLGPAGLIIRSS